MSESITDEQLVDHIKEGRVALFEMLMYRHTERLRKVVRSVLKDEAQVDDVLQETFMRAFSHLSELEGTAKFGGWVTRIAVNEAIWRKRRAVDQVDVTELDIGGREAGPEDVAASKQLGERLEQAVEQLPDIYKDVFMLRTVDGLSVAETSWVLGVSEEAVRTRAFRAHELLRDLLSEANEARRRRPATPRTPRAPAAPTPEFAARN
ncbi:MAG: sigma-70 family RNA polymerase sigma factor [Myxococcaceae bacterium]|nr:sigma-70 family RNA polymerase sigma factor [Myxococcaceae bacterium]